MGSTFEAHLSQLGIDYEVDAKVCSPLLYSTAGLVISPEYDQIADLLPLLHDEGIVYQALGSGSNTLLAGGEISPLKTAIISLKRLRTLQVDKPRGIVHAEAGTRIGSVSKFSARAALSGLEFACDIPGTTAGAIATDAWHPIHNYAEGFAAQGIDFTTMPKTIRQTLLSTEVVSPEGKITTMTPDDLGMHDRKSILTAPDNELFLLSATFGLEPGDSAQIFKSREVVCHGRQDMRARNKAKNPYSVGRTLGYSFVLNHQDYAGSSAAQLIAAIESLPDEMYSNGMYHSKATPNIISNHSDGTADGYLELVERIQEAVAEEHGIEMPLEVKVVT